MDHRESFFKKDKKYKIDLHLHSTSSDGTRTPAELVDLSLQMKGQDLAVVAITDHDTVAGIPEFLAEAARYPGEILAIGGVEISCDYEGNEIHMLGYGVDPEDQPLNAALAMYREERDMRNSRILAKIREAGMEICEEDIKPLHEGDTIGRPAIARYLLEKGYVASVKEAFDRYLAEGRPCYVDRKKPDPSEALALIHNSGGIAVLAHPVLYKKLTEEQLERLVKELTDQGLEGMESFYSRNKEADTDKYCQMADRYGLFTTCGSDYHGDVKPDLSIFVGEGNLQAPMDRMEAFFYALENV